MTKKEMEKAVERYNVIMMTIGYEHNTIGTHYSESTDNWNLRDMVAEADYTLSTYFEGGHCNEEMRHGDADERKMWRSEVGKLQRFIKRYEPYIKEMKCTSGHCSMYD